MVMIDDELMIPHQDQSINQLFISPVLEYKFPNLICFSYFSSLNEIMTIKYQFTH